MLVASLLLLLVFGYSAYKLTAYLAEERANSRLEADLRSVFPSSDSRDGETLPEPEEPGAELFQPLLAINPDVVGWLRLEAAGVDHPVVQTDNNSFYLDHNFKREPSKRGAIFVDHRNSKPLADQNTVIYGHNFKNSMFGGLVKYKQQEFYRQHQYFELELPGQRTRWHIFSVFIYPAAEGMFPLNFTDGEQCLRYIDTSRQRALYKTGVAVAGSDTILTLVTCTYEFTDARLVIQAKKVP